MNRRANEHDRIKKSGLRMAFELAAVCLVIALTVLAFRSGVLNYVYAFSEIMNMQNIRESLDGMDRYSYEYYLTLSSISDKNYYLVEIFDSDGNRVYSNSDRYLYSGEMSGDIEIMYGEGEASRVFKWIDDSVSIDRYDYSGKNDMSYFRFRVALSNGDTLRLWVPYYLIERNAKTASVLLTAFSIIAGAAACSIILVSNLRFSRPVAAMAEITEAMAKLDFTNKCDDYRQTDVQNLGKNINILSESLSETLDELKDKNEKLTEELEHSALVDESRKSFIANVSHELKTPIAIIQGYAEGLKLGINGDHESSEEYCDIILEETGKMNQIVMDLLNLEKLESGSYVPTREELNLSDMIAGQLAAFAMMFNNNGITVINRVPQGITVHSDERTILLVLQNFLSNAVSNISGKKIVQLTLEDNDDTYRVSVYNSGDPISYDEIDKIWYSFYKSSKKRRDEAFHFGLGLPVVKAVQNRLGKECGVVNEYGGVRFWFDVDK